MERWPRIILTAGFLCLLVFPAGCGPAPTAVPDPSPVPATPSAYPPPPWPSTIRYPSQAPYPSPEPTQDWRFYTPPPYQSPTPTPVPTATPPPTAVSLPPADFDVLWLENGTRPGGGGRRGVIWRADPRDIANRWEVVSFDRDEIHAAVVSPDERLIALTAGAYSLWVCNLDGSDLRQVVPDAWQILWSQNNRAIFYEIDEQGSNQTGVEWVNLANGEIQRVLTLEQPVFLHLLGWSPGGQWLYYIRSSPQSYQGYELWKMRQDGSDSQVIVSLGATLPELSQVILSPDGSKLVVGAYERLSWVSTNGQKKEDLPVPPPGRGFQVQWAPGRNDEVIVGQYDERQPLYHLYAISIPTYSARELATFGIPAGPGWDRLALSPDHHWLMAHLYQIGYYWIHLPTGTMIPILCQDCSVQFVAWVSREPGP